MKFESQLQIVTAAGVPPFTVNQTALVINLNADLLDGQHGSYYAAASSLGNYLPLTGGTLTGTLTGTIGVFTTVRTTELTSLLGSNGPITITPDGTGHVHINSTDIRLGPNNTNATLATRGTGDLILRTNEGSATEGFIRIYDGANGNIEITPNGTGTVVVGKLSGSTASFSGQVTSTVATGTAPLVIASTTAVANLNADLLDGQHGSYYQDAGNLNAGTVPSARLSGSYGISITGSSYSVFVADTRSVATTPQSVNMGVFYDFKQNSVDGLNDGGTYFGEMTFRQYGSGTDWSGGLSHQLGFTDNGNVWQRSGSSTTWGSWKKLLDTTNFSSHALPLTGGTLTGALNGTTASFSGNVKGGRVTLRDDCLEQHVDDSDGVGIFVNYFGYASGTTRFRNFGVFNGKNQQLFYITGSTGATAITGTLSVTGAITQAGNQVLHAGNYGGYSTFSGAVTSGYGTFASPGHIIGDAQYGFYVSGGNLFYKSASTGNHVWRNIANSADTMTLDNSGNLLLSGSLRLTDTTTGISKSGGRLSIRSESTDDVANFASYGLYLPKSGQTAGLYVESAIEARAGIRLGTSAANGTITVGADTANTANRLVQRDGSGNIAVSGIKQGADLARPLASWGVSGTSTGMVIFSFPGGSGNYGMVHCVFDIYEYNSNTVSTVIVGGHNWNGQWYNTGSNVIGRCGKTVRLGFKDGKYCVVFGGAASSWEYGTIVLRKIHNGAFYTGIMDMGGAFTTSQTATESFTWVTGDLRVLRSSAAIISDDYLRGTEVYSSNWFRNDNSGSGIYNSATSNHFYSDGPYWNVAYSGTQGIRFRNGHNGTILGYIYAETDGNFGLLSNNGGWAVQVKPGGGGNLNGTWTINSNTPLTSANYSGYALPLSGGTMTGDLTATRIRGVNSLVLNTFTTVNPASNVFLYSQPNDRDAWIFLDSADTGSNWGIYHRQIDSAVSGLPANSIGFIGGGSSALQAWISLANGSANFQGALTQAGNQVLHAGNYTSYAPNINGGSTIAGITYFSNGESMQVYGIRGRFTNEYLHLYNKVGVGHPSGWGSGETNTPDKGLSTYGGINVAYGNSAVSSFAGQLNANGGLSLGGPLYYSLYTRRQISLAGPSTANFGNWKQFIRLWAASGSGANLFTLKVSVRGSWNWTPVFGTVEAYYSLHLPGDGTINTLRDFRLTHISGPAADNLRLGDAVIENGYISIPVWGANTNALEATVEQWNGSQILGSTTTAVSETLPAFIAPNFRGGLTSDGNAVLHAATTSAPNLSIGGNAATATNASQLGGNAAANFVQGAGSRGRSTSRSNGTASNLTDPSGFYYGVTVTGMPTTDWWHWIQSIGNDWSSPDGYGYQLACSYWSDDLRLRRLTSGTWGSWVQLLHSGNYSSYALPLSGGTMTGSIQLPSGGYVGLNGGSTYGIGVLSSNRSSAVFDTVESTGTDPLELNYYQGGPVKIGSGANGSKSLYAVGIYDNGNQVIHAGNFATYGVLRSLGYANSSNVNWNTLGNVENTTLAIVQETFNISPGTGNSNFPTNASYKYGVLLNVGGGAGAGRAQVYISHAGNDLIFRGGWGDTSWQTWNKCLTDQNYSSYALPITGGTLTGALSGTSGSFSGDVTWSGYNSGNARAVRIGYSGGNYGSIGYGINYTSTTGSHTYAFNDAVTRIDLADGIQVYSAAGAGAGTTVGWTTLLVANRANSALQWKGVSVLDANNYSSYALPLSGGTLTGALSGTSASFSGALSSGGNSVLTVGNYSSYAVDNTKRVKQFFWDSLSASTTQARRFEIARIAIDIVNWNNVGTFEIELCEQYYSKGIKKRYAVWYGYSGTRPGLKLIEMTGAGDNNFQVVLGSEQPVSGNQYYLPIYVDIRYYSIVDVRVTTSRQITSNSTPPVGYTYINSSPTPTNITDFTADSTVDLSNAASAWQVGGNTIIHSGNYTSYPPARWATGRTISLTGDVTGTSGLFDGTANLSFAATLANSGVTAGTYNNVTVNAKGIVTSGSNVSYLTGNQSISITGDATGSGSTAIALTLANSGVTAGTYRSVTVDAKGRVTAGTNPTTLSGYGITDIAYGSTGSRNVWTITDWNQTTYQNAHFLSSENTHTNGPSSDFIYGLQTSFHRSGAAYRTQMVTELYSSPVSIWVRNSRDSDVWTTWSKLLHSNNYTDYAPTKTGGGASGSWGINITGSSASVSASADQAIVNQHNGSGSAWYGRILSKNSTNDRSAFLGTYGSVAGVFAHNNALTAWADLYINTVDGSSGGTVRMPASVLVSGNQVIHTGNYVSYSPSLTGGGASGTWGINISGSSASCSGSAAQLNGQAASYYENRDTTSVSISAGTLTLGRGAGNLTTTIGGRVVAWCDFNGNFASSQSPNASFNVSSITKNATGDYTVNFSSSLGTANYVVAGTAQLDTPSPGQSNYNVMVAVPRRSGAKAAGSCRVVCEYPAGVALYDSISVGVAFIAA